MVLTVEPGIYFMDCQIDLMKRDETLSKFVNPDRLEQFRGFGGVRIEDVVVVRKDGIENLTQTPRSIEEVCRWSDVVTGCGGKGGKGKEDMGEAAFEFRFSLWLCRVLAITD